MKLTRSQIMVLIVLGVLTLGIYGCLVGTVVINSRQISQAILPKATTTPPPTAVADEPTTAPTATTIPSPTPTPTPAAPQTRYDLQVTSDPSNPAPRLQRGYVYIKLNAYARAVEDFDTAIELDATLTDAYVGRGEAYFYLKEWSAALSDFEQALAQSPDRADVHAWRGYVLSLQGQHRQAIEALRQAVALDGANSENHLTLADALLHNRNYEEARLEYTTVLSLEIRSVGAYVGRAMAWAEEGNLDAAEADLSSAQGIAPHDPVVLNGRARFYAWYRHGNLDEAKQLAQRAVDKAEDDLERATYLGTLGWIYYQQGQYDESVSTLEEATALATVEGQVIYSEIQEHLEEAKKAQ
ncbi:MAG: hypothetical protein DRI77_12725 [Chloroflexi bacterium]|nr:MAG: hypothetical protein DRI77_12725 [Chloroflexota bacterium]